MIELPKQQRVVVLVLGSTLEDDQNLQRVLPENCIQWLNISEQDLSQLESNAAKVDCILVRYQDSLSNLGIIENIRSHASGVPIIVYGSHWHVQAVVQAMKYGATEVCEFPENPAALRESFLRCTSDETRRHAHYSHVIPKSIQAKLTSEEARILHLLVQGRTTKEVGATLDVSIRTVHYRKKELLRKLGVQNRSEAIELIRLSSNNLLMFEPSQLL